MSRFIRPYICLLPLLALGFFASLLPVGAEEEEMMLKAKDEKQTQTNNNLYLGFTRPGYPSDREVEGKILFASDDADVRKTGIGGTVYYMVLKRDVPEEGKGEMDTKEALQWDVGDTELLQTFKPGIDGAGKSSPGLDAKAKYLYIYQVVNDRQTHTPIESSAVKLIVDPKEITSWGHFSGAGFATVEDRSKDGKDSKGKLDDDQPAKIRPVSVTNILASTLLERAYREGATAVAGSKQYRMTRVPTQRGEQAPKAAKSDDRIVAVHWDALDPAMNPTHVLLLNKSDFKKSPSLRVLWNGDSAVKKENRSTIFGFTSNLPPTLEPVRIRGIVEGGGSVGATSPVSFNMAQPPAENDPSEETPAGLISADGNVPTPRPPAGTPVAAEGVREAAQEAPPLQGFRGPFGSLTPPPGNLGSMLGGSTTPGLSGGAGISGNGQSRGSGSGGGGNSGGGSFGGGGNQGQNGNISINMSQSQSQSQSQWQWQTNGGGNGGKHCGCDPNVGVVPAPAAVWLALLGLPALIFIKRRPGSAPAAAAAPEQPS